MCMFGDYNAKLKLSKIEEEFEQSKVEIIYICKEVPQKEFKRGDYWELVLLVLMYLGNEDYQEVLMHKTETRLSCEVVFVILKCKFTNYFTLLCVSLTQ